MTTVIVDLSEIQPFTRHEAVALGRIEYERFIEELEMLEPEEWERPTDCDGCNVRDMAGHLVGSMDTARGLRQVIAEQRAIKKRTAETGETEIDAMGAIQVEKLADLAPRQLIARMRDLVGPATSGRSGIPEPLAQRMRFPVEIGTISEKWSISYLRGVVLTRDTWLHRVADLARATGRPPRLDEDHDAAIVADVAAEWTRRHGQPVDLVLTGAAGSHFRSGDGGPGIEMDAVEFCRILSGRAEPSHRLLETQVPF